MIVVAEVVGVSRGQALQVNDVVSLVGAFYTFDLYWTSNIHFFLVTRIDNFLSLDVQCFGNLHHETVEVLVWGDAFFVVDNTVLGKLTQVCVVEDSWNDWLADQPVAFVVDDASRQVI